MCVVWVEIGVLLSVAYMVDTHAARSRTATLLTWSPFGRQSNISPLACLARADAFSCPSSLSTKLPFPAPFVRARTANGIATNIARQTCLARVSSTHTETAGARPTTAAYTLTQAFPSP